MYVTAQEQINVQTHIHNKCLNKRCVFAGHAGAVGSASADVQHHQVGAKEESSGRPRCFKVLRLQGNRQQPEIHELHRYTPASRCLLFFLLMSHSELSFSCR